MTVVIPFHAGDVQLALNLLHWIALLGKQPEHRALLVADADVQWHLCMEAVRLGNEIFRSASLITNEKATPGWIPGSNSLFEAAAKHMQQEGEPWLWIEPDATPTRKDWLEAITKDYQLCNRPFMGSVVHHNSPNLPNPYLEGCGVYPADTWTRISTTWNIAQSWTLACASVTLPNAFNSKLFQHFWGPSNELAPTFAEVKTADSPINTLTLDFIKPETALYHRCKDGSLINLLRRKLFPDMYQEPPTCFVQLGRIGDIILLLPAFKEWRDRTGKPPFVMCSREFGSLLEGCSYVAPVLTKLDWHHGLKEAVRTAKQYYSKVVQTQLHGAGVDPAKGDILPSYSMTMWTRTGLSVEDYDRLPLVFDRRNQVREMQLVKHFIKPGKPTLLLNFDAWTSPLAPSVLQMLQDRLRSAFAQKANFLYTTSVRAHRVFDILGLYDVAAGMITADTMTLHLAAASRMPYVALVRDDGQSGSIPKGNVKLTVGYSQIREMLPEIIDEVERWL